MDDGRSGDEGEAILLDASGHRVAHVETQRRATAVRADLAVLLVGIIATAYFWKVQPVSLVGSTGTAAIVICSVMWLVMDFAPWFREIALRKRVALTGLFGGALQRPRFCCSHMATLESQNRILQA